MKPDPPGHGAPMPWDGVVTEHDIELYRNAGYGRSGGLGQRPAVLVVDATYGFVGDRDEPVTASIRRYPKSSGSRAWSAVRALQQILPAARHTGVPVLYSTNPPRTNTTEQGAWGRKTASVPTADTNGLRADWQIIDEIEPQPGDLVVYKTKPSAFYGTPLVSWLVQLRADTLLVAGGTTSGCVRASVTDAFSNNLHVGVIHDAVFDRVDTAHKANLFDIHQKYADLLDTEQVVTYFDTLGTTQEERAR